MTEDRLRGFNDIDRRVCTGCGACVSICPIEVLTTDGAEVRLRGYCIDCGLCYAFCPGREMDFHSLSEAHLGSAPHDALFGHYRQLYVAQACSRDTRSRAASGGVVTALLTYLLETGQVGGAVGVTMRGDRPWECEASLLTSPQEVRRATQSKYSLIPLAAKLRAARRHPGPFAVVGLPCHVHGLRRLQRIGSYREKFPIVIGLFCGFNLQPAATHHLIEKLGFTREHVADLQYRAGDWPGGLLIRTRDGQERSLPKDSYGYVNLMYVPRRCLACPDLTNELADLSVGDTWLEKYSGGWATVVCRSPQGQQLLTAAVSAEVIRVKQIGREELLSSHGHLLAYKKEGFFVRQSWLQVPLHYRLPRPSVGKRRWVEQSLLLAVILLLSNTLVQRVVQRLPLSWLGPMSRWGRAGARTR